MDDAASASVPPRHFPGTAGPGPSLSDTRGQLALLWLFAFALPWYSLLRECGKEDKKEGRRGQMGAGESGETKEGGTCRPTIRCSRSGTVRRGTSSGRRHRTRRLHGWGRRGHHYHAVTTMGT